MYGFDTVIADWKIQILVIGAQLQELTKSSLSFKETLKHFSGVTSYLK